LVLLDPKGTLICYSGAAPSMAERVQWSRNPVVRGALAMGHADSDHFYAPHEAERALCSLVRVPEFGWAVGTTRSYAEAMEFGRRAIWGYAALLAALGLATAGVAVALGRHFSAPIARLLR